MDTDSVGTIDLWSADLVVRSILRGALSCFDEGDMLSVDQGPDDVRVAYVSLQASAGPSHCTCMQCQIYLDAGEMWIANLRVAAPFRLQGLGRQLVTASERIAREMGIRIIRVFPFLASEPFWRKMGYEPDPRAARVLLKDLSWQYVTHNGAHLSEQLENGGSSEESVGELRAV